MHILNRIKILTLAMLLVLSAVLTSCAVNTADPSVNLPSDGIGKGVDASESETESGSGEDTTTVSETETDPPGPVESRFHFLACPDNIIHPSVYYSAINTAAAKAGTSPVYYPLESATYDFSDVYRFVADEITSADLAYINVETMIGGNANGISGYPQFNSPEAVGEYLCTLGFDVMNVAHNHMLDSGNDKYLKNCYNFFKERGKSVIGYYANTADTDNIVITETNGIKVAWLAYTYGTNGIVLRNSETYIPYFDEALIRKQVALAKEQADVVFVSAHWGTENSYTINAEQAKYSQLFVDLDVDVIIGMHPHCLQEMKWFTNVGTGHRTLCVYSMGNFVSGMYEAFNMLGGMLAFDVVKNNVENKVTLENILFKPVVTHYYKERILDKTDTGYRGQTIYYLKDYTDEIASTHYMVTYEKTHRTTLMGGGFNRDNLIHTVKSFIPEEFLEDCFK